MDALAHDGEGGLELVACVSLGDEAIADEGPGDERLAAHSAIFAVIRITDVVGAVGEHASWIEFVTAAGGNAGSLFFLLVAEPRRGRHQRHGVEIAFWIPAVTTVWGRNDDEAAFAADVQPDAEPVLALAVPDLDGDAGEI